MKNTAAFVFTAHFLLLMIAITAHFTTPKSKPIVVRTQIIAPQPIAIAAPPPKAKPAPTPTKKQAPAQTKKAVKPQLAVPKKIEAQQPVKIVKPQEVPNDEYLIAYLQTMLDLPEFGSVKMRLEINADGSLKHLEILESKSELNAEFLRNRLPELTLPCFNESKNLTITFRNVEAR